VSFKQRQDISRFQNAPKVNFFLQPHLMALPKLEGPAHLEARPLLKVWNLLFLGFMVSSAFGLYAHASVNELATVPETGSSNLPSYELAMQSEPIDKTNPLKPLTETVQQLAVIDELPELIDGIKPNSAQDDIKNQLNQHNAVTAPLNPLPISGMGQLGLFEPAGSSKTILDDAFEPDIDESGLTKKTTKPTGKARFNHTKQTGKTAKMAEKSPYDFEPEPGEEDEEDADKRLLNKILAKPHVAVGMPQILPKSRPSLPDSHDPASRYGSKSSVIETTSFMSPLRRLNISSRYGWRYGRMHSGIDLAAPTGSDILAVKGGTVVYSGWQGGYGKTVIIDHGDGRQTRYAHCHRLFVSDGQKVSQGERIALVGNTGHSTGSHLHFEVLVNGLARNPENFLFR
jgi:murein DD-endopeptidase MepM/ murein hydrolase activator NlpD